MGVVLQGEVIRFDQVKGYGFVAPKDGGADVFLHVNDLLDDKHLMRPGAVVEFVLESGERGPKASSVHLVSPARAPSPAGRGLPGAPMAGPGADLDQADGDGADQDDDLVDVLSPADFRREVTEVLLRIEPSLGSPQVLAVREAMLALGKKYGWIGN